MFQKNIEAVVARLKPGDKVLDIGGWGNVFPRANYVIDVGPYETRQRHTNVDKPEQFTKETWIERDICDHQPYPFADKELDFVTCAHTLEDIRDPLWVCAEMIRISKAGYIEVPSRLIETCRGVNRECPVGYHHHRWLIEIKDRHISFRRKDGVLYSHWSLSFPRKFLRSLSDEQRIIYLFWENSFEYEETLLFDRKEIHREMAAFVAKHHPYPAWRFRAEGAWRWLKQRRRDVLDIVRGGPKKKRA
jgi:hypothetical protein